MNRLLRSAIAIGMFAFSMVSFATEWNWQQAPYSPSIKAKTAINQQAQYYSIDTDAIRAELLTAATKNDTINILLPNADGDLVDYIVRHDPIAATALLEKYPTIRTFSGYQVNNPSHTGRFDIGPNGFYAFYNADGQMLYIDPSDNANVYLQYAKPAKQTPFHDQVIEHSHQPQTAARGSLINDGGGVDVITMRLAVTTTNEYTAFFGGLTAALNGITTTINRVNQIYQTDLAVKLELVANTDQLIFTSDDPYTPNSGGAALSQVQTQIDNTIGSENYDVGHLLATEGAGLAALGAVCVDSVKAQGLTGISSPQGDAFDVDYVSHELGHQFGANHTYNGSAGGCNTRAAESAYEPGSGITIMAYAGICADSSNDDNLASNSIAMFHSRSIDEMHAHLNSTFGSSCGTISDSSNNAPVANAGSDYTIPTNTPFVLTGSATDANADDQLTYAWEQFDLGASTIGEAQLIDNGSGPLFRPFLPHSAPTRYLPRLQDVLSNTTIKGEAYPTTDRTMNFRLVVRDNQGGVNYDTMQVTSSTAAGSFSITAPTANEIWAGNSEVTVSWNVASTDQSPILCSQVDITMSSDNGASFATTLLSNTANDGTEVITAPNNTVSNARLMVKCSDNIFYAASPTFSISESQVALEITGQEPLLSDEDMPITLMPTNFTIVGVMDESAVSINVNSGDNYTVVDGEIMPMENFNGSLTVPVSVSEGDNTSGIFNSEITINPVNDAPVINNQINQFAINQGESVIIDLTDFTIVDPDADDTHTLSILSGDNFTASGNTVTPSSDFAGNLPVTVRVTDNEGAFDDITVTITVTAINQMPTAMDDQVEVDFESSIVIAVLENDVDPDGDTVTIESINYIGEALVEIDGNVINYMSAANFSGVDQFTYTISDGQGGIDTALVEITVALPPEPEPDPTPEPEPEPEPTPEPETEPDVVITVGGSMPSSMLLLLTLIWFRRRIKH